VGNDTRAVVEGKAWVFERGLVSAMFEAIAAYGGAISYEARS
jgi:hypothetical protein